MFAMAISVVRLYIAGDEALAVSGDVVAYQKIGELPRDISDSEIDEIVARWKQEGREVIYEDSIVATPPVQTSYQVGVSLN